MSRATGCPHRRLFGTEGERYVLIACSLCAEDARTATPRSFPLSLKVILSVGLGGMLALVGLGWWKLGSGFALVLLVQVAGYCALWAWMLRAYRS